MNATQTAQEIVEHLRGLSLESYKRTLMNHGIPETAFGVKIEELKKFQKQYKKNYELSMALYDTGIYDAQYLASLIADEEKMTPADLEKWLAKADCDALAEFAVGWVAADGPNGWALGLKWIESDDERVATAGWTTLSGWLSVKEDKDLDLEAIRGLMKRVQDSIHTAPNRVKYHMNSFVISVGGYVTPLADEALAVAEAIGKVSMKLVGGCKLPSGPEYIRKMWARGGPGKKRKMCRC